MAEKTIPELEKEIAAAHTAIAALATTVDKKAFSDTLKRLANHGTHLYERSELLALAKKIENQHL